MTYVERDIHGAGECSPAVLRAAIVDRGKKLAGRYAPGGIYREPPAGIELVIIAECQRFPGFEIDPDGVTVQINEETAGMQSAFWVERNNPGGIGAVDNDPDQAIHFPTPAAGIRAHVAKLRNYRFGEGPWSVEDPRAPAIRDNGWMDTCRVWGDLQGKWATSPTYRQSLESIWTRMTVIRNEMGAVVTGDIPGVPFIPADRRHYTPGRSQGWPIGLVGHHTDGRDSLGWLTTSLKSNVSATLLLWHDGTIRAQLVRLFDTAHTTAEWNEETLSFEWERYWADLTQRQISSEQYANIAHACVLLWLAERTRGNPHFQGLPRRDQFKDHNDYYPSTTCPGNLDMGRVWQMAVAELAALDTPPAVTGVTIDVPGHGPLRIYGGIYEAWTKAGGIAGYGYPLNEEHEAIVSDARREQDFQRGRAEWAPGRWPDNHDVTWALVNVELIAAREELAHLRRRLAELEAA